MEDPTVRRKKKKTLSDEVRRAVMECGMTRYEIAKRSGIAQSVLSRFVTRERTITLGTLDRLADVVGVEVIFRGATRKGRRMRS